MLTTRAEHARPHRLSAGRIWVLARAEATILRSNRGILITVVSPIAMLYVVKPVFQLYGEVEGTSHPILVAAPAVASMWAFFLLSFVGFAFFRERMWHTWDRLLVSGATRLEITIGKLLPMLVIGMLHQAAALSSSALLYGLDVTRTALALAIVGPLFVVVLLVLGMALVELFTTLRSVTVAQSVAIMVGGAAGGAITPRELLPDWMQHVGRFLPNYWSQLAYTEVLEHGLSTGLIGPAATLSLFGLLFAILAALGSRRIRRSASWV